MTRHLACISHTSRALPAIPDSSKEDTMTCFNRDSGMPLSMRQDGLLGKTAAALAAAGAGIAVMSGALAQAQQPPAAAVVITVAPVDPQTAAAQRRESVFRTLDVNGDGFISREEASRAGVVQDGFASIDSNNDSRIDRAEFVRIQIVEGAPGSAAGATASPADPGAARSAEPARGPIK
jgi:hypothetical protein